MCGFLALIFQIRPDPFHPLYPCSIVVGLVAPSTSAQRGQEFLEIINILRPTAPPTPHQHQRITKFIVLSSFQKESCPHSNRKEKKIKEEKKQRSRERPYDHEATTQDFACLADMKYPRIHSSSPNTAGFPNVDKNAQEHSFLVPNV